MKYRLSSHWSDSKGNSLRKYKVKHKFSWEILFEKKTNIIFYWYIVSLSMKIPLDSVQYSKSWIDYSWHSDMDPFRRSHDFNINSALQTLIINDESFLFIGVDV